MHEQAESRFPAEKFSRVASVPVFAEHETTERAIGGEDGERVPVKYDLKSLRAICERCNERIADTGDYAALAFGHTPDKDSAAPMPDVAGYAGPFYIGQIGNKKPRWAIFQDEHWLKEHSGQIAKFTRRSPEIWLSSSMDQRFMDPIAVLGAETPRLDMGMRFCRTASGELVEKYSAASLPACGAVFVPGHVDRKKKYQADSGEAVMIGDEEIKKIADYIMATAPMQWVIEKMKGDAAPDPAAGGPAPPVAGAPPGAPVVPPAGGPPAPKPEAPPVPPVATEDDKEKREQYARRAADQAVAEKYSRLEAENADLKKRVQVIERDKTQAERYGKLTELARSHAMDIEAEVKDALDMTDTEFSRHLGRIERSYEKIPVGMPNLYAPPLEMPKSEKYAKERTERAVTIATTEGCTFEEALRKADEAMKVSA